MIYVIIGVAVLIVAVLAVIAYRLQTKVNTITAQKAEQEREHQEQAQKKRDSMNKSIQILAQGLHTDQVSKTEAAIRISVLMEFLGVDDAVKEEYSALFQLADATAHIPILEKWKALPTKEKLRYDNDRMASEEQYGDFVVDAAKRLMGQTF